MARKLRGMTSGLPMFTIGVILSILAIGVVLYVVASSYWKQSYAKVGVPTSNTKGLMVHTGHTGHTGHTEEYNATPPQNSPSVIVVQSGGGDGGQQHNPFIYENERNMQTPPAKPFYYPTRGVPQSYQQYGVLIGEERRHRGEQTILPLIGRQTHPGSSRYHYYTSTNGYHPMKLPVVHKKRTCNDSTGCEEIFGGNIVSVNGYDYDFKADIYPSPDLQYIL